MHSPRTRFDTTLAPEARKALRQLQRRARQILVDQGGALHQASAGRILDALILQECARVAALDAPSPISQERQ